MKKTTKCEIDLLKYNPINTTSKVDAICVEISKIQGLTSQKFEELTLMVMYQINKLKIQLYFKAKKEELSTTLMLKKKDEVPSESQVKAKKKELTNTSELKKKKKTQSKFNSVSIDQINDSDVIFLFLGRKISLIEHKYKTNNQLFYRLKAKGFELDSESKLEIEMIEATKLFLKRVIANNLAIIPINILKTLSKKSKKASEKRMEPIKAIESVKADEKKIKKRIYGPDCLPIPREYIHNDSPGNVYGCEGNWYKMIKIRSR